MVEKVDRPEPPPTYRVQPTVETRGGKGRQQQEQQGEEDEFSAGGGVPGWQKYHTSAKDRRALKLRRQDIRHFTFYQAVLQKGLVIIEVDIHLVNSKVLPHSHIITAKIDTYWKLKNLGVGTKIAVDALVTEPYVEASVLQKGTTVKTTPSGEAPTKSIVKKPVPVKESLWTLWPLVDKGTGRKNWVAISIYSIVLIALIVLLIMIL